MGARPRWISKWPRTRGQPSPKSVFLKVLQGPRILKKQSDKVLWSNERKSPAWGFTVLNALLEVPGGLPVKKFGQPHFRACTALRGGWGGLEQVKRGRGE